MDDFEQYQNTITVEQVKDFLVSLKQKGFRITQGRPTVNNGWAVELGPQGWIGIQPYPHSKGPWCLSNTLGRITGPKSTLDELKTSLVSQLHAYGITLDTPPKQQHTDKTKPLSLWASLNIIIGSASITDIYDPYFKNRTLLNLILLNSIDTKIHANLRLLTCDNNVSLNALNKFNIELRVNAELRITVEKNHPRLIFLNDGRCISLDFSLEKEQTGTITTVEEVKPKRDFFEAEWSKGTLFV